jgi:hypothetical protein
MTLAEIRETLEHISDEWRSGTAGEQKMDLADLDDLLGQLDDLMTSPVPRTDRHNITASIRVTQRSCPAPRGWNEPALPVADRLPAWGWVGPAGCWPTGRAQAPAKRLLRACGRRPAPADRASRIPTRVTKDV